jgi:hypothetical protein
MLELVSFLFVVFCNVPSDWNSLLKSIRQIKISIPFGYIYYIYFPEKATPYSKNTNIIQNKII